MWISWAVRCCQSIVMAQIPKRLNDELMEYVRMHPTLYDRKCKYYGKAAARARALNEIAKTMDTDRLSVDKRYKNIRAHFSRYLSKHNIHAGSSPTEIPERFEKLQWLIPYIDQSKQTFTNRPQPPEVPCSTLPATDKAPEVPFSTLTATDEDASPFLTPEQVTELSAPLPQLSTPKLEPPKRQLENSSRVFSTCKDSGDDKSVKKEVKRSTDPNELFCLSLIPKMAGLTDDQRDYLHIEILQLIRKVRNNNVY